MWYAGIDVSKENLDVHLLGSDPEVAQTIRVKNTAQGHRRLLKWLRHHGVGQGQVCLEATGIYGQAITQYLYEHEIMVSVVNPARIKKYAESRLERHKTDAIDAKLIAIFCQKESPELWMPPAPELALLQALVRRRNDLLNLKQQERNRLESAFDHAVIVSIEQVLAFIERQIQQVEEAIQEHVDQHPQLKQQHDLIASIPGLGTHSACVLLAECKGLTIFDNVRQLVAFVGLNPQQRQSGRMNFTTGISRMGRCSVRSALYMPALSAMRCNTLIIRFVERLRRNGLQGKQVIVAVMRKLVHLAYGVLKSQQPFDPHYAEKLVANA